jgi:hypothetical protein
MTANVTRIFSAAGSTFGAEDKANGIGLNYPDKNEHQSRDLAELAHAEAKNI